MNTAIAKSPVINMRYLLIGLCMLIGAGLAFALTPRHKVADGGPKINLEAMIPERFGEWKIDQSVMPVKVSPDVQAKLDRIYNQTLSRTYINGRGERIMLSIAYGSDQSDSMAVHKPEVCYPSQGFELLTQNKGKLMFRQTSIPVVRLVAKQRTRIEPITYWITVGNQAVTGGMDRKLAQLRYSLTGTVPDGLLFRVSSIGGDVEGAYQRQDEFVSALLSVLSTIDRKRLIGV